MLHWQIGTAQVAYSTALDGDMHDPPQRSRWLAGFGLDDCARHKQVHGRQVRLVERCGYHGEGDGLVCRRADLPLLVYGADCPGLALIAPDVRGLAHCGWRGCAAGLPVHLLTVMRGLSARAVDRWQAVIGPGICPRCYEVDAAVIDACDWRPGSLLPGRDAGHAQLDLRHHIAQELRAAGLTRIEISTACTACGDGLWSYRRQGKGPVQALLLW